MAIPITVTKSTISTRAWNLLFKVLNDNLTNPHTSGKWIYAAYPEDKVTETSYPLLVIPPVSVAMNRLTLGINGFISVPITSDIEIYTTRMDSLDSIADEIVSTIDNQLDTFYDNGLTFVRASRSSSNTYWTGKIRIHSRVLTYDWIFEFESGNP